MAAAESLQAPRDSAPEVARAQGRCGFVVTNQRPGRNSGASHWWPAAAGVPIGRGARAGVGVAGRGPSSTMSSPPAAPSAPPTPVQIREANAHLAALHGRVAELERRLAAAEQTVRGQAESLIRKDQEMRGALRRLREAKDTEIATLEEKLLSSEEKTQKLLGLLQDKDTLILQLKHRSHLLTKICRSRPVLDNLLAYMAEGERLSPVPGTQSEGSSPDCGLFLETNCTLDLDSKDFSLCNDDQELGKSLFGTTV